MTTPDKLLRETPSQTAGPFVHIGLLPGMAGLPERPGAPLCRLEGPGERLTLEGRVLDGAGAAALDAVLELYQADGRGRPIWGRAATDFETGLYRFETVRPAPLAGPGGALQAPHFALLIFARGVNLHLQTRAYLPGDDAALAADPVLARTPSARRSTLLATEIAPGRLEFIIRLRGDREFRRLTWSS